MPQAVSEVDMLRQYIRGVMDRAEHHARGVDEVILAITGAVLWRKDDERDLEVHEREGDLKNVLWVWIGGNRYALSYNHSSGQIEVRQGSTRGTVLASFSNDSSAPDVKGFFASL